MAAAAPGTICARYAVGFAPPVKCDRSSSCFGARAQAFAASSTGIESAATRTLFSFTRAPRISEGIISRSASTNRQL